jgi:hypothetical protein
LYNGIADGVANPNPNMVDQKSMLIIADGDMHVYPIFWRHPFHRFLSPLGLSWLFNRAYSKVYPDDNDANNDANGGGNGDIISYLCGSRTANDAIVNIANFINKNW